MDVNIAPVLEAVDFLLDIAEIASKSSKVREISNRRVDPVSVAINFTAGYEDAIAEGETKEVAVAEGGLVAVEQTLIGISLVPATLAGCGGTIVAGCVPGATVVFLTVSLGGNAVAEELNERYSSQQLELSMVNRLR